MKIRLLGAILVLVFVCCTACGKSPDTRIAEQAAEQQSDIQTDLKTKSDDELLEEDNSVDVMDEPAGEQTSPTDEQDTLSEAQTSPTEELLDPIEEITGITAESTSYIEEPVGYLKDKVTETGVLGEDYPILSYYGQRSSMNGQISSYHRGMDFGMEEGTPLMTPCDCLIKYTGFNETRGYWVVMYWGNGYYIVYQHMSQILVRQGMRLARGNKVGYSGDTGASLVPHLHLEILQCDSGKDEITDFNDDYVRINPYYFVFGNESVYAKP